MGYMISNTGNALRTWSDGNDGGEVREFTLPEPDRRAFADHLAALGGSRVLVVTREWSEDSDGEADDYETADQSRTEVVAGVSPVYVANVLAYWGMSWSDDGGEHYASEQRDNHYVAGPAGRPVAISAQYSARLIGFRERELCAIYRAVGARGSEA